jgi:hypothetical protein
VHYRTLVLLAFCAAVIAGIAGPGTNVEAKTGSLDAELGAAAKEYEVPKELLLAMGYVNTHWEMPSPETSYYKEGGPQKGAPEARGSYGIMQIVQNPSEDALSEAVKLTGTSEEQLKTDREQNILGGAALLAEIQGDTTPEDLNGWYDAVAEYGDGPLYADEVYEVLQKGSSAKISTGERVTLAAQEGTEPQQVLTAQTAGDYRGSTWYGASPYNYTSANRPYHVRINKIVIHVAQGSYSGTLNWFLNSQAQASAHYTVNYDGAVGQSVQEKDIAWHAGNWKYNKTSIGIEHAGYINDPSWFTDSMYRSSAKLTAYLCRKYEIPVDLYHIIGHNEVPDPYNPSQYGGVDHHQDPGPYWNWNKYMNYVRLYS